MNVRHDGDVIVIGAGAVGMAFAAAAADAGLSVVLCDRSALCAPDLMDEWDPRVYAISPGSACFLSEVGVWQRLPGERLQAVESMRIWGDDGKARLDFSAYEQGERALAWIVENQTLQAALVTRIRATPSITVRAPAVAVAIEWTRDGVAMRLSDGATIRAALIVGADGAMSWVRDAVGIGTTQYAFEQTANVANFSAERAHHGRAYQWFMADGSVLAWLPLPGRSISMVWSAPDALAPTLAALPAEDLAERVAAAGSHTLGTLSPLPGNGRFPLRSVRVNSPIASRVALIGDAAHSIHPLAGQGVNLGLGDARALAHVLSARGSIDDCGSPVLLERFAKARAEPVFAMQAMTEGLYRLFGASWPGVRTLRNVGMATVGRLPALKRLLAQPALR